MSVIDAITPVGESIDGGFKRTAIVLPTDHENGASVDIVLCGEILARINIFNRDNDWLAVDVIDVKDHFLERKALTFLDGRRASLDAGKVVGADFRR